MSNDPHPGKDAVDLGAGEALIEILGIAQAEAYISQGTHGGVRTPTEHSVAHRHRPFPVERVRAPDELSDVLDEQPSVAVRAELRLELRGVRLLAHDERAVGVCV